jgi:hypothetical protein
MTHELKAREIFAVGVWNDIEFSEADLDDIVANFEKLKENHKVPLKFGHEADHKDGQPAIGWVEKIYKVGEKLFADFTHLPRTVYEAIQNKLYRSVSIELLFNVDADGAKFNHVLDAVALLGADHPAVNTLSDLDALLATRTAFTGGHRVAFETIAGKPKSFKSTQEDEELDAKEVQAIVDKAMAPVVEENVKLSKDLKEANDKIAKFTSDKADDEKRQKEEKVKLSRKAVTDILDAAVRAKTLTPAFRENYEKQIGLNDDERVIDINLEDVKTMFRVEDTKGGDKQGLHGNPGDEDKKFDDPEAELLALTRKNRGANESFEAAFSRTTEANPELHVAYLNANGEVAR